MLQSAGQPVSVRFRIHFVTHFNQQSDVFSRAKASIQAKDRLNRSGIGQVILLKLFQTLMKAIDFTLPDLLLFLVAVQSSFCLACLSSTLRCNISDGKV